MNKLPTRPTRVLLIDDHASFRQSVAHALSEDPNLSVVDCASIRDGLPLLLQEAFDLVLLDNDLGSERGSDFLPAARQLGYMGFVLVVTAWLSQSEARRLLRQGVNGIFLKQEELSKLVAAIQTVAVGGTWLDCSLEALGKDLSAPPRANEPLFSDLQKKVLRFVLEGLSNKEIGARLRISESYVKAIIQTLFHKTGVRTRGQLVRLALEQYADQL